MFYIKNYFALDPDTWMKEKILALKASVVSEHTIGSPAILIILVGAENSCLILHPQIIWFHTVWSLCMQNF